MPDRLVAAVPVGMARDVPRIQPAGIGQDRDERRGLAVLTAERVELDTVARGEPCELAYRLAVAVRCCVRARTHPFAQHGQITPELFAVLNGCSPVVDTDAHNPMHEHSELGSWRFRDRWFS